MLDVVKCIKMKKSRRIVSFWMLLRSKIKEVSQNCLVFKLADRQTDRQREREKEREKEREREKKRERERARDRWIDR